MILFTLEYEKDKGDYTYSFSANAPSNCKPLEYSSFSEINLKGQFILFIGSIWSGNVDVRIAEVLGDIASDYPEIKFYFKVVLDEVEVENIVPKEVMFTHLPIILYVEDSKINTISTGLIKKIDLENKIKQIFGVQLP